MVEEIEKVRLQIMVRKVLADKIDELSGKLKMSRSDFVAEMIEENIKSEEWMVNFVTSRFMAPVRAVVRAWQGKKTEKKEKKG